MAVCEILPHLWLGDIRSAKNKIFFDDNNIEIVINCTKDIPFFSNYTTNIRISINDNLEEEEIDKFYLYIDKAVNLINKELLNFKNILVHCYAGKQRSASIISCYLMKYANMSLKESIESVKSKRSVAFTPGINFSKSLLQFEKDLLNK
tara:strand:+ start:7486 stop:7932 length:447 start_codon:yes stop_codon:yes gene_type:complete